MSEEARVRDRLSEILDEVEDSFGKPFHPQERENLTVAILENMAEQTVALKARAQAAEQSLAAADKLVGLIGREFSQPHQKGTSIESVREAAQHYRNTREGE